MKTHFYSSKKNQVRFTDTLRIFILSLIFILPFTVSSQILNGSFETGTGPDLSDWNWTCGAESFQNAPTDGGTWCIKVTAGNPLGPCLRGFAYQKLTGIDSGQKYELSGWQRAQNSTVGIYFGAVNNGVFIYNSGVTSEDTVWTKMTIQSTFALSAGDTACIILNVVPKTETGAYGYFDLISVKSTAGIAPPGNSNYFRISPNPFSTKATLELLNQGQTPDLEYSVVNLYGQTVISSNLTGSKTEITRGDLPAGVYFIRLLNGQRVIATDKLIIAD
jgi:hypothetical protein